jgi:hypothetical protein
VKPTSIHAIALCGVLGLAACAADPIDVNPGGGPDAGGGGGGGDELPDAAPVSNRVTDGLTVLYDFKGVLGQTEIADKGPGAPMNLTIGNPEQVVWGDGYLTVNGLASITSDGPATKIYDACTASNAITIEAWVKPATLQTNGRIVSMSPINNQRNLMLKQAGNRYQGRVRTNQNAQGVAPEVESNLGTASIDEVQHIVVTRLSGGIQDMWVNNRKQPPVSNSGTLAPAWSLEYPLGVANEGDGINQPWPGDLYLVAIYCRALSPAEVKQNYEDGY